MLSHIVLIIMQQVHEIPVVKHLEEQVIILRKIGGEGSQDVMHALNYRILVA